MTKRKKKPVPDGEGGVAAENSEPSAADVAFEEGIKKAKRDAALRTRLRVRINRFKKSAKLDPVAVKRLVVDILEALD